MKEDRFIKENSELWNGLESTLKRLKTEGIKKFSGTELDSFISHYNRTCGHLSYSRTNYGNTATTVYLNRLVASAHSYIYSTDKSNLKSLFRFLLKEFPVLIKDNLKFFLLSSGIFLLGFIISYGFTILSTDNASAFVPFEYLKNINLKGSSPNVWNGPIMSSFILTNNIKVGFVAFSLGMTLGVGTVWALISNSFLLGGIAALAQTQDSVIGFWSLILPHGILELFAIFVCGAAGLIIGYSLINPGSYSRKDSIIIRGKTGIKLVLGTIPIFVIAGLIEGFITPMDISEWFKLGVAFVTLVLLLSYLILPNVLTSKSNLREANQ